MSRIFTVAVRESLKKDDGTVIGYKQTAVQVSAASAAEAIASYTATLKDKQPEHAENYEVIGVSLTYEAESL